MLKNFFVLAMRNFTKHRLFSLINVIGLALGLTTCILILIFVQDELKYDKHWENNEQIFRVENKFTESGEISHWAASQGHIIPFMMDNYPEIEAGVKIMRDYFPVVFKYNDVSFKEKDIIYADSSFFRVFSMKLLYGDKDTALIAPGNIVISETVYRKYFGNENPLGKIITTERSNLVVAGVFEDIPEQSHFHFSIITSLNSVRVRNPLIDEAGPMAFYSYVRLKKNMSSVSLEQKLNNDVKRIFKLEDVEIGEDFSIMLNLKPITDIHLKSNLEKEFEPNGNFSAVIVFSTIAIFVLIIACINYTNLSIAKSSRRTREIGLRKVVGASRTGIFKQFISETLLMTTLALILALFIIDLLLPSFNNLTGKNMRMNFMTNYFLIISIILISLITSFISGFYPAFVLSGLNPVKIFKTDLYKGKGSKFAVFFGRSLVVLQFTISVALIISAIIVYQQLNFINTKKLGFNKEQVIVMPFPSKGYEVLNEKLKSVPEVVSNSPTDCYPGIRYMYLDIRLPDLDKSGTSPVNGQDVDNGTRVIRVTGAGTDIVKTLGLEITEGRDFSTQFETDQQQAFILNEAAVKQLGIENPIGKDVEYSYNLPEPKKGKIIGIVKDFHYASLHNEVEPLMIHIFPLYYRFLLIRFDTDDVSGTLEKIKAAWKASIPDEEIEISFLDSVYDEMYKTEMNLGKVVTYFTILAIIIAGMGLFGLSYFVLAQKMKEIAVRKVHGASTMHLISITSREFLLIVLIADALAWFPSYYFMKSWLENFVFRIDISVFPFLFTSVSALLIAFSTVGIVTYKSAQANPIEVLRYE